MRDSYMEYAMSVIVGRALPDVRDGLKPVHRRVLFSMNEQGNEFNKPFRKSARVVGDVIGVPSSGTLRFMTPLSAWAFSMRYQLVDGQGNLDRLMEIHPPPCVIIEVGWNGCPGWWLTWTKTPSIFNRTMMIPRKSQLSCQTGCRICWPTDSLKVLPSEWPQHSSP